jgi:release factor glutamine methyltransferase
MIDHASAELAAAGVDDARRDAELLLAEAMGVSRSEVVAGLAEPTDEQVATFESWVARRAAREPFAYIVGRKGFRRIDLVVDERVLIPRPETELLVAVAKVGRPCGILDVATGSGAVALALADELPDATIMASDVSADALDVARLNAERLGAKVEFVESDLLDGIDGVFDAITANLPYVTSGEMTTLQREITEFEPALALDGGEDGLDLVRRLADQAPARLRPGGLLALEIGAEQGAATAQILREHGFVDVEIHADLAGLDRVVSGSTPS